MLRNKDTMQGGVSVRVFHLTIVLSLNSIEVFHLLLLLLLLLLFTTPGLSAKQGPTVSKGMLEVHSFSQVT